MRWGEADKLTPARRLQHPVFTACKAAGGVTHDHCLSGCMTCVLHSSERSEQEHAGCVPLHATAWHLRCLHHRQTTRVVVCQVPEVIAANHSFFFGDAGQRTIIHHASCGRPQLGRVFASCMNSRTASTDVQFMTSRTPAATSHCAVTHTHREHWLNYPADFVGAAWADWGRSDWSSLRGSSGSPEGAVLWRLS